MSRLRRVVLLAALALLAAWVYSRIGALTGEQHGTVRLVLGTLFAALVLFRSKPANAPAPPRRSLWMAATASVGALAAVGGVIFDVHQVEWLGMMLLLQACLRWSLPERFAGDILKSLFIFYWIHPLPGQIFNPLQLAMQHWSIAGAEWLLHALNVRVWADDVFLYAGFDVIQVPDSCSGMRTAVSVLLCGLGVGLLFRFNVIEMTLILCGGLLQVLALNVLRISWVVSHATKMPAEWSEKFLHDTLGIFLLSAIVLVQIEAAAWQFWKSKLRKRMDGIARNEIERPERATRLPRFWHLVFTWAGLLGASVVLVCGVVFAVYKSRPVHREQMRRDVIDGLMDSNLEAAERAINHSLRRTPRDQELLGKKARVQVMRREFGRALETFDAMTGPLSPLETTLKSWSLMAQGRANDAIALIDAMPQELRYLPGVAMVRAEYAARIQQDPELTSRYIVHAGSPTIVPDRVRALFPFLAQHEQWAAIARADPDMPYRDPGEALIAVHACLRVGNLDGAGRTLNHVLRQWGQDPRFLRSIFMLASRRPGSEWEDRFAEGFAANFETLEAGQVVPYIAFCFQLARPDLAWLAYLRLLTVDPRNPDIFFTPAQFGNRWYAFRRHAIGASGGDRGSSIDLRPLAAHTRHLWPLDRLWARVPLEKEFSTRGLGAVRERYLAWTLRELETREKNGSLSQRDELIFPSVLASARRFDEAHARLDVIRERYPVFAPQALLEHAEFYDTQKRWEEGYEALREYELLTDMKELQADLIMVNAQLNLNLAVSALETANRAAATFPGIGYTDLLRAAIWDIFGFKEQALFALGSHTEDVYMHTEVRLLAETGRRNEYERVSRVLNMVYDPALVRKHQPMMPIPAEMVIARRWPEPPAAEALAREAERSRTRAAEAKSPFIRALEERVAAWYAAPDGPASADVARWRAAGRDPMERGTALHRLAVLQARSRQYDQAAASTRAALEDVPSSAVLHRILIALTEGDAAAVQAARAACPTDPEIWLAHIVTTWRDQGNGPWALAACEAAIKTPLFAPGTLTRAGDFFLRQDALEPATLLARDAIQNGRGLVNAYALGLRCALQAHDSAWALTCARDGIDNASDPSLFHRAIVEIKSILETPDKDLITALEYLNEHFPQDPEWTQYLGHLHFQQGDAKRALTVLEPLVARESTGVRVRSLLLAAEAARVSGYDTRAVGILERTLALHPDQMSVLNNLIYTLSQRRETAPRARELLPRLLEFSSASPAVLDTAAMVYLRSGDVTQAREFMQRAMAGLDEQDYAALEMRLNSAEILIESGEFGEARTRIEAVRRDARINTQDYLDSRARRLLEEVQRRESAP